MAPTPRPCRPSAATYFNYISTAAAGNPFISPIERHQQPQPQSSLHGPAVLVLRRGRRRTRARFLVYGETAGGGVARRVELQEEELAVHPRERRRVRLHVPSNTTASTSAHLTYSGDWTDLRGLTRTADP